MEIEKLAEILIYYMHVPMGILALLAGATALVTKKGSSIHKKSGKIFFYAMLLSAIAALLIAVLPYHENSFLFSIGLFSSYFLISGLRSLQYKKKNISLQKDKIIAWFIIVTGLAMICYPIIFYGKLNIVLTVFGFVGIVFGIRDLQQFKNRKKLQKSWLKLHLGKMTGGYIAAISAFFVVNQILPGIWNWFVPTIIGSGYITYWMFKLNRKKT